MNEPTVQFDLRAVLPVAVLAIVVLTIILVEICGREGVKLVTGSPTAGPTGTVGPTFTPGPSPTESPAQATATVVASVGGSDRDQVRQQDLAEIQQALEAYRADKGEYPNTHNNIQTLCVYEGDDIGCALKDFLDPLPQEPLGDPSLNGYFYQSDGERYVLYAIRESDVLPECDEHPEHLAAFDSILCLRGPSGLAPTARP